MLRLPDLRFCLSVFVSLVNSRQLNQQLTLQQICSIFIILKRHKPVFVEQAIGTKATVMGSIASQQLYISIHKNSQTHYIQ